MSQHTQIQWADSTCNAQMGCDGCELWVPEKGVKICYAGTLTERQGSRGHSKGWPRSFGEPALFAERIAQARRWRDLTGTRRADKPWLDGMPRLIFLNDMGDTFTESLPLDWLEPHMEAIADSPHRWLILTKRPKRAADFFNGRAMPDNIWVGTSITGPGNLNRIRDLYRVSAALRFVSIEPLQAWLPNLELEGIGWGILGGGSGEQAQPFNLEWAMDLRRQFSLAGVPFHVKQLGAKPLLNGQRFPLRDSHGGDWSEWPSELRVRNMPRRADWFVQPAAQPTIPDQASLL